MAKQIETKAGGSPIATDLEMVDLTQPEAAVALDLSLGDVEKSDKKVDAPIDTAEKVIENATKTDDGATAEGALKASPEKTADEATAEGALKASPEKTPDEATAEGALKMSPDPKAVLKIDAKVVGESLPEKALESGAAALVKGSVENVKTVINGEKAEDEIPKVVEKTDDLPKDEPVTLLPAKLPMAEAADVPGDKGMKSSEAAKAGNANDSIEKADGKIVESKNQEEVVSMDIDMEQNKENENADGGNVTSKEQEKNDSMERDTERARKHKSGHKREGSSSRASHRHDDKRSRGSDRHGGKRSRTSDRHDEKRSRDSDRHDKDGDGHSSSGSKSHYSTRSSRSKK